MAMAVVAYTACIGIEYRSWYHSDSAMYIELAKEIRRTGDLFPATWHYGNDLHTWGLHIPALVLLNYMPEGYDLHTASAVCLMVVFVLSVFLLLRELKVGWPLIIALCSLCMIGHSAYWKDHFIGQTSYLPFTTVAVLWAWSSAALLARLRERRFPAAYLTALIQVFIAAVAIVSGFRGLLFNALPMLLALAWVGTRYPAVNPAEGQPYDRKGVGTAFTLSAISIVVGLLLHFTVLKAGNIGPNYHPGTVKMELAKPDAVAQNAGVFVRAYFTIVGGWPEADNVELTSPRGAAVIATVLLAAFLVFQVFSASLTDLSRSRALVIAYARALLVLFSVYFAYSSIPFDAHVSRYLIVPSVLLMISGVILLDGYLRRTPRPVRAGVLLLCLGLIGLKALSSVDATMKAASVSGDPWSGRRNAKDRLHEWLRACGLKRGYATFWNASVLNILSTGEVDVAPVSVTGGTVEPFRLLVSEKEFAYDGGERPFILLTKQEVTGLGPLFTEDCGRFEIIPLDNEYSLIFPQKDIRLAWRKRSQTDSPEKWAEISASDEAAPKRKHM